MTNIDRSLDDLISSKKPRRGRGGYKKRGPSNEGRRKPQTEKTFSGRRNFLLRGADDEKEETSNDNDDEVWEHDKFNNDSNDEDDTQIVVRRGRQTGSSNRKVERVTKKIDPDSIVIRRVNSQNDRNDRKAPPKRTFSVTQRQDEDSEEEEEEEEEVEDEPIKQPTIRASVAVTKLLVTNLPHTVSETEIKNTFATVGHISRIDLKRDGKGESMGIMDVYVANETIGKKLVECFDRIKLGGNEIRVNLLATDARLPQAVARKEEPKKLQSRVTRVVRDEERRPKSNPTRQNLDQDLDSFMVNKQAGKRVVRQSS